MGAQSLTFLPQVLYRVGSYLACYKLCVPTHPPSLSSPPPPPLMARKQVAWQSATRCSYFSVFFQVTETKTSCAFYQSPPIACKQVAFTFCDLLPTTFCLSQVTKASFCVQASQAEGHLDLTACSTPAWAQTASAGSGRCG